MEHLKGRLEDYRMLTGSGRYASDWNLPGQAYANFLRSDRAHAEIVSIDTSAAASIPGVLAVLTGKDIEAAGFKSLPSNVPVAGRGGMTLIKPPRPALALGKVRYVGEAVAMVVAESASVAQDATELIRVDYRELPAVTTAEEAIKSGAPQLHEAAPGNLVFDFEVGDAQAAEAAMRSAAHVVRLTVHNTRVIANPMEPRACLAAYDAHDAHYVLHACTQGAAAMRGQIAAVLGVPPASVSVVAREVGGSFGVRSVVYPEYCATLLAAKKLGRPIKWTGARSEAFLSDNQGRDVVSCGELALDASGRMLALRFNFLANLGAYLSPTGPLSNTVAVIRCLNGVYDVKAASARVRLALTNTAPTGAYRGAGRPIMSYVLERLVDQAGYELGIDPGELRRRNMIAENKFPYKTASGAEYDCGDFAGVLDAALGAADWHGFDARREESARRGRLRGRGIATSIEATGANLTPFDAVEIRFDGDGAITLRATTQNQGQGHETCFAQIVSGALGVPIDSLRLCTAERGMTLEGGGAGGSRTLVAIGGALLKASRQVIEKGLALAAEDLEVAVTDVEFADGAYRVKGTDRSVRLAALAKKCAAKNPHPLDTYLESTCKATFPNGCHIVEVEVDPDTGEAEIDSYVACDDCGNVINHQIVEGQVHGGLTQGAGQALREHAVYDPETGQLLTGSFMDYAIPRAVLVNGLKLVDHPVPTATNAFGAKGVGESGVTGSMPALMNAVLDALRQAGVTHFDMPASPNRVWRAIQAAKAGNRRAFAVADLQPPQ